MLVNNISFKGALDAPLTSALRTLDKNPVANAVGIDLFAMVGPRTYVDTKNRNKYAGAETFFREFTGTITVCLSASWFAKGISILANKIYQPEYKINTKSWFTNDSINYLNNAFKKENNLKKYISNIVDSFDMKPNTKGLVDEAGWKNYKWDNEKYKDFYTKIKDKKSLKEGLEEIIKDKSLSIKDKQKLIRILDLRITNFTQNDTSTLNNGIEEFISANSNIIRDAIDMGRDVFSKPKAEQDILIKKMLKINKIKSIGALVLASSLGLVNQYINRKITEKRTGTKGFVGDINYRAKVANKESFKDNSKKFMLEKLIASLGMAAMAIGVMRIKSLKDFVKKLEFNGPVNSGNVIKTVYASTLIGRFLASQNQDELRETVTRDYLGFLNWLVLGGFMAKLTANMLDKNRSSLFKGNTKGKGIKNWLNNISLKSHNEIAIKGKEFARKNLWKLNISHIAGLAYSTIALGILLPKLNIWVTKHKSEIKNNK